MAIYPRGSTVLIIDNNCVARVFDVSAESANLVTSSFLKQSFENENLPGDIIK